MDQGALLGPEALRQIRDLIRDEHSKLKNPDAGHRARVGVNECEWVQGFLEDDLEPATAIVDGETTATLAVWCSNPQTGELTDAGRTVTITNRSTVYRNVADNYQAASWFEGEWRAITDSGGVDLAVTYANITGLTTSSTGGTRNAGSGTLELYTISSTGGLTSVGSTATVTGWNYAPPSILASSTGAQMVMLHRHSLTGRYIISPPPHVVEIAKADSQISACSSGGTAGSGTCSIYELSTANVLADTGVNVTALNLSLDPVAADKWLQLVRHYRSGKWLVNFEDCGTTS